MFRELKEINSRPAPFQFYTADELWTNEHTSKQMLEYHLNESLDLSSRSILRAANKTLERDREKPCRFKGILLSKIFAFAHTAQAWRSMP